MTDLSDISASAPARARLTAAVAAALVLVPKAARAYGGPGSIVSGIGAFLAAVVAVAAAVAGFFWFPIKRLVQKLRSDPDDEEGGVAEAP